MAPPNAYVEGNYPTTVPRGRGSNGYRHRGMRGVRGRKGRGSANRGSTGGTSMGGFRGNFMSVRNRAIGMRQGGGRELLPVTGEQRNVRTQNLKRSLIKFTSLLHKEVNIFQININREYLL